MYSNSKEKISTASSSPPCTPSPICAVPNSETPLAPRKVRCSEISSADADARSHETPNIYATVPSVDNQTPSPAFDWSVDMHASWQVAQNSSHLSSTDSSQNIGPISPYSMRPRTSSHDASSLARRDEPDEQGCVEFLLRQRNGPPSYVRLLPM